MENLRYRFSYVVAHQRSVHVAVHTLVVNEGTMQILICAVVAKSSPDWVHGQPAAERKGTMQILICAVVVRSSPDWVYGQPAVERKSTTQILICAAVAI